ncbi:MAG TPA: vitamin B12-dependent ribonucleotide reductase [Vicinamibacterales bacterium]|jgi:ribonucleoside-diphosphate reductase alpha chain|nr:ribonucleoside-diphosphate reductase, adenosylcobalamin-dependent [Acidobacteriota bacterium]MDP7472253.1 vitamin B12-dependent ribonucleotide reductase [Vicinamibacterales bacterium]HJO39131.1 vitamin B12-dependent ribonucleotide reductase [Vicinamibacterales bacterium]|tara:strand:- start:14 stop:2812 length:2799 start_codon:yes stop_codon:yes gene_type:complete
MERGAAQHPEATGVGAQESARRSESAASGLRFPRVFTRAGIDPFDEIEWELRSAVISSERGEIVFEQRDVEIPKAWSQQATNIVVSKYFRGQLGAPEREHSVKQLIGRVVDTITQWGREKKYFASDDDLQSFSDDLKYLLVQQRAAFNSPVWFNCGFEKAPQCSACFINSVQDTMDSILTLAKTEGMLFKFGSGTGSNLSAIRSSREALAGGGTASGPVSFMKGYDAFAGVIKSGGKTRRAAKMVILNADHPDIEAFINCKVDEERKAWALIDAGYDGSFTGPAYASVFFQNSNNSVRVTDEFMRAVLDDDEWKTHAVRDGEVMDTYQARSLMSQIANATHVCGDPGMQFDTTINDWHTCQNTAPINASNPCSEYMFLDDSACNLASLNLMTFVGDTGEFDPATFTAAVRTLITAQEIIVDSASYPTKPIERNSHDYRPLGLGYANLGALLMSRGVPYDSEGGRDYAAAITALMTGEAYAQSARIARDHGGPFAGYEQNAEPFLRVMRKHRTALKDVDRTNVPSDLYTAAKQAWNDAVDLGEEHGFRNAQATVLAPTGTIGFMMDCDTTGVEPDIALVKYKKLVGGGMIKIVNQTVPMALTHLGYDQAEADEVVAYIDEHETIEGAPHLKEKDLAVFDCAFKPAHGERSIDYMGHVRMIGATQPFISGAISKTVNVPKEATVEEIQQAYVDAWRLGTKAVSIYRDGSKRTQPLNTSRGDVQAGMMGAVEDLVAQPVRRRLPDERRAITHKFDIGGHEGYITIGLFEDGSPGEIFLVMAKEGSTISGFADAFAQAVSYALQYGVPLQVLVDKFSHVRFEPSGLTKNPEVRMAKSIVDYIFRWMATKFLSAEAQFDAGVNQPVAAGQVPAEAQEAPKLPLDTTAGNGSGEPAAGSFAAIQHQEDAPPCSTCGEIMVRSGSCYKCNNCGTTSGCA